MHTVGEVDTITTKRRMKYLLLSLIGAFLMVVVFASGCAPTEEKSALNDDAAQLIVVARLVDMAQTPEAKEYVGILFPSLAEGDFVERHDNLKAYKFIIDKWPSEANEAFKNTPWFDVNFDDHFSSFNRPTWVIYDDGKIVPQGSALLVEAGIDKLNMKLTIK